MVAGDWVYVGAGVYDEQVTPTNDGTATEHFGTVLKGVAVPKKSRSAPTRHVQAVGFDGWRRVCGARR